MKYDVKTVDEYIELLPPERKASISKIRKILLRIFPKINETMKYNMPTYLLEEFEIAFASQKHYISVYIHQGELINKYKKRFSNINAGKSCLRFKNLKEVDYQILTELFEEISKIYE